jgi:hypothetical protein
VPNTQTPVARVLVPRGVHQLVTQTYVPHQLVLFDDALQVREDLRTTCVDLGPFRLSIAERPFHTRELAARILDVRCPRRYIGTGVSMIQSALILHEKLDHNARSVRVCRRPNPGGRIVRISGVHQGVNVTLTGYLFTYQVPPIPSSLS